MSKTNDDFFEIKKDWSKTKDAILGSYLVPYFSKLLFAGRPICYVDCFAGKGMFGDGNPGSPLIAIECIEKSLKKTSKNRAVVEGIFIELHHSEDLRKNIQKAFPSFRTRVVSGKFEDNIDSILSIHKRDTIFLYIDPYGIKALNVNRFNDYCGDKTKSTEMLINFNTWGFMREACRVLKVDFQLDKEISKYLIEYEPSNDIDREGLNDIAGGSFWETIVLDYKNGVIDNKEAEQRLAKGIADSFRQKYKYVLNVPIKSNPDNRTPKYRLFHLTKHEHGCLLMAETMYRRINESIERQHNNQMSLLEFTVEGDVLPKSDIKTKIKKIFPNEIIGLNEFLCKFFTEYGIVTSKKVLNESLLELEAEDYIEIERIPSVSSTGKPTNFMSEEKGHIVKLHRKG